MIIDLSQYPAPPVLETLEYEEIFAEIREEFLALFPASEEDAAALGVPSRAKMDLLLGQEGNLISKMAQSYAYHAMQLRARVNDASKARMVAYATGADLDHVAVRWGVTRREGEIDGVFRDRIILAIGSYQATGTEGHYATVGMAAHPEVKDVSFTTPSKGQLRVSVLSTVGDGTPSAEVLAAVSDALQRSKRLTDELIIQAPAVITYQIEASIYCYGDVDTEKVRSAAEQAAQAYADARHALGHDVTTSGLHGALHQPGVQRAVIHSPALPLTIEDDQAAYCTGVTVTYEGNDV